nr:type-F conjugative transfer system pilin acetylase TraX [Xenorhabdus bovienii]
MLTWTSGQIDLIKTVALVFMVLDHTNRILSLGHDWMTILGRGAFPLFGLVWAANLTRYSCIRQSSLNHLWGWAVIAQFSYFLAGFPWWQGNILFAFAITEQAILWFEQRTRTSVLLSIALVIAWLPLSLTSYGVAGVFMLINSYRLFRFNSMVERIGYGVLWVFMVLMMNISISSVAAIAGIVITGIVLSVCKQYGQNMKRLWPKNTFVLFYVVHLSILGVMA